jgi:hypothetical protein
MVRAADPLNVVPEASPEPPLFIVSALVVEPPTEAKVRFPEPSVTNAWLADPSVPGRVNVTVDDVLADWNVVVPVPEALPCSLIFDISYPSTIHD